MRLTFYILADFFDQSESEIIPIPNFNEVEVTDERLSDYLDFEIADLGVTGGVIRIWVDDNTGGFEVSYTVPEKISDEMVQNLKEFTIAQFDDGVGEDGFGLELDGKLIYLKPDTDTAIRHELIDDRKKVRRPSRIAIAAREGRFSTLRDLLKSQNQEINNLHQGFSALHLAIIYGHFEEIKLLISYGADLNLSDIDDTTPLELCALSNSLDDDQSCEIAKLLLSKGANPKHICSDGETAESYALCRNKSKLVQLLSQ